MDTETLKELLDNKYRQFNRPDFIEYDPIAIPRRFTQKGDIEISGFFAATLAWGNRKSIIQKCSDLLARMDNAPYDFIAGHTESDLRKIEGFVYRTFNDTDALFFIRSLQNITRNLGSLENAFGRHLSPNALNIYEALTGFHQDFFAMPEHPGRTRKHVATPIRQSACKRLNMFLRWMVRTDDSGVDFGIWQGISPSQLICPCDVHVERIARRLNLSKAPKANWNMALEITESLKAFDPHDPVKYDFALFGLGLEKYFG